MIKSTSAIILSMIIVFGLGIGIRADAVPDRDGVYFFSMGHEKAPVFPGSVRITQNSLYNKATGYGWIHEGTRGERSENLVARLAKPNSSPTPDSISGNRVFWRGGDKPLIFRVDVPDGKYRVWVYSGAFDFDRFVDMVPFQITAGGKDQASNADAIKNFKTRFFREFDDSYEYKPDWTVETIWEKYIKDQSIAIYDLDGVAKDGQLDIAFHKHKSSSSILPINAIVICPLKRLAAGEKAVAGIENDRRAEFVNKAKLIPAKIADFLPEIPANFRQLGYVPYVRDFMKKIYPNSIPMKNEITQSLSMFMAQGQREILSFAFYPLRNLKNVKVEVSRLSNEKGAVIDGGNVKLEWMRYMIQPLDYMRRTSEYRGVPVLMMENKPLDYIKGMNRQYILTIATSPETAPGIYHGAVTVTAAGEKPLIMPLQVKVYPFKLETYADDDERIWLYYADRTYKKYAALLFSEEERWQRIDKDLAFMKQQLIAPTILFDYKAPEKEIDRFMTLYTKYGFRGYGVFGDYAMLGVLEKYCTKRSNNKDITPFIDKIKAVLAEQKKKNWPKLAFYTFAEMKSGMPAYRLAQEMLAQIKQQVPEAVLITLPNSAREAHAMIDSQADIVGPNAVSMTEDISNKIRQVGKKLWFYGWGRQRFRCGLIDWRLGNRGGIKEWYNYTSGTPFNPVDGICFDCWNDAPPFMGPNGPISTLGMEETTQGRIDFFYIVTLEKWIERAKQKKNLLTAKALRQAEAIIADLKKKIVPDYFYYYKRMKASGYKANQFDISKEDVFKWKDDEYQIYRRKIADAIVALKNAIAGIEPAVVTTAHNAAVTQAATEKPGAFTTAPDGALILTVDDFTDAEPAWSPDGNIVSYVSKRSDGNKIILGRLNSKSTVILPDSIMPDTSYSWSPKADQIAFTAVDGVVKVVSLKNNRVIPLGKGKNPVFSPDGQKLAYFSAAGVMVYDFSSVKTSDLSQSSKEEALEKLCWSNDGKSIYYSKDGDIWAVSVTGTNNQRLLDHSRTNLNIGPALENPVAAPDGKMLYLTLNYDGLFAHASNNQLAVYRFADNKLTPICDANSWSLSPDGKKIIYGVGDHLISYDTVSARKTELFKGTDPAFSPDGKRIAYLYRQSLLEEPEVRIADLP